MAGEELVLADAQVTADLRTFVVRARSAADGAIRLQASGTVLAAWVGALRPRGLGEAGPTVLGLRTMPLAEPAEVDSTVELSAVADRLARMAGGATSLSLPPVQVHETWAGISPPRSGWEPAGTVPAAALTDAAAEGMRLVAEAVPQNSGAAVVDSARNAVWGRPLEGSPGPLPSGAAFAAVTLGFLPRPEQAGPAPVLRNGRWLRLSLPHGHVLVRQGAAFAF